MSRARWFDWSKPRKNGYSWREVNGYNASFDQSFLKNVTKFTATQIGTRVYFIGHLTPVRRTSICCLDLDREAWQTFTPSIELTDMSRHTTVLYDDKLYCLGGESTTTYFRVEPVLLWTFDVHMMEWSVCNVQGREPVRQLNFGPWDDQFIAENLENFIVTYRAHKSENPHWARGSLLAMKMEVNTTWTSPIQKGKPPSPRLKISSCSTGRAVYLYGGVFNDSVLSDLFVLETDGFSFYWSEIKPGGKPGNGVVGAAMVPCEGRIFMWGGVRNQENQLFCIDEESKQRREIGSITKRFPISSNRGNRGTAIKGRILFFGGQLRNFKRIHVLNIPEE